MDPRRIAILAYAASQIGPGDVPAYMVSAGLPANTKVAWCGIFTLACLHAASVAQGVRWISGLGYVGPQHLSITKTPQPGDVFYKDQPHQHYGLVEDFDPITGRLVSIEGNTPSVQRLVHDHPTGVVYYSIEKFLGGASSPAPSPSAPPPAVATVPDATIRGIDVSHHQDPGAVDYARLAKTHRFVIARATYGTRLDEAFAEHARRAQGAGLTLGAYHFFRAGQPVADQLDAFLQACGALGVGPGWLPPAIDVEQNPAYDGPVTPSRYAPAEQLAACFREQFGACLVYTNPAMWAEIGSPAWLQQHGLWVSHYGVQHPTTPLGAPWLLWQHLVGPLPGIAPGPVDQNVARSLPILRPHDPAAPEQVAVDWDAPALLDLTVDWDELRAERDAEIQEKE